MASPLAKLLEAFNAPTILMTDTAPVSYLREQSDDASETHPPREYPSHVMVIQIAASPIQFFAPIKLRPRLHFHSTNRRRTDSSKTCSSRALPYNLPALSLRFLRKSSTKSGASQCTSQRPLHTLRNGGGDIFGRNHPTRFFVDRVHPASLSRRWEIHEKMCRE
jgi:hypothetical protein